MRKILLPTAMRVVGLGTVFMPQAAQGISSAHCPGQRPQRGVVRKVLVLLGAMFGLVLFVPPAGAQSGDITVGWGTWFGDTPTSLNGPNGPSDVVQMVTTNSDTYVLDSQGTVWAAGDDLHGELGVPCASPCNPTTTLKKVKALPPIESLALVGPEATMMAIARGSNGEPGDVYGWGNNQYGELCKCQQNIDPPIDLTQAHDVMPGVTLSGGCG